MARNTKKEFFSFSSEDEMKIQCYKQYLPKSSSNATVIIIHGMADHFNRYEDFSRNLCFKDFLVYGLDLRGHGKTVNKNECFGHLSDEGGWAKTVGDIDRLLDIARKANPKIPLFLFGHSMGELLIRDYIIEHSHKVDGIILSGVAANPGIIKFIGQAVADIQTFFKGKRYKSVFLTNMLFGKYNDAFKPNRTESDWISSIETEVDKYIADPYCKIIFTAGFFQDLNKGFTRIHDIKNMKKIRKDLPILILAGKEDVVGNKSKGVVELYNTYEKIGMQDISSKLYEGIRHEITNDRSSNEVVEDLARWIKDRL